MTVLGFKAASGHPHGFEFLSSVADRLDYHLSAHATGCAKPALVSGVQAAYSFSIGDLQVPPLLHHTLSNIRPRLTAREGGWEWSIRFCDRETDDLILIMEENNEAKEGKRNHHPPPTKT